MPEFKFPEVVTFEPPPEVVYKFRHFPSLVGLAGEARLEAERKRSAVVDAVCEGKLYLSHPASFTDPFDCHVNVVPRFSEPAEQRKAALAKLKSYRKQFLPTVRKKYLYNPGILTKKADKLIDVIQGSFERIREETKVYSVAGNRERPLLWAHYADGHRGVCLHIDASIPPFSLAYRVRYQNEVGRVPAPYDRDSSVESAYALKQLLCIKDQDWEYEDESRFVPNETEEVRALLAQFGTTIDGVQLKMPRERIAGLTVGARMDPNTLAELRAAISIRGPDLPIYRAIKHPDKFELTFELIQ